MAGVHSHPRHQGEGWGCVYTWEVPQAPALPFFTTLQTHHHEAQVPEVERIPGQKEGEAMRFYFVLLLALFSLTLLHFCPGGEGAPDAPGGPLIIITSTLPGSAIALSGEGSTLYENVHIYVVANNSTVYVEVNGIHVWGGNVSGWERVDLQVNGTEADIRVVVGEYEWRRSYTVIHQSYSSGVVERPRKDLIEVSKYYIQQIRWKTAGAVMWGVVLAIFTSFPLMKYILRLKGAQQVYPA